ncbi:hypothetical protein BJF79_41290 [Actinomadura sp. CNU-125]|uniref:hypothetical protein n=1 Tax=Actinomadura sp. CNU-125 TaxID=1904961 RepID=UPI000959587A|nr:hypothetical protein [Actinomadura sp. CNU-125]OLT28886.1 hypothetical protein BJF79_41290 [Actinomadura sp. CNU-125]
MNWDDTRTQVGWYRAAGGTGSVVVNVIPVPPGTDVSVGDFTAATVADLDRAVAVGADEVHVATALLGVSAQRQVELLEALADELGLPARRA